MFIFSADSYLCMMGKRLCVLSLTLYLKKKNDSNKYYDFRQSFR